VQPQSIYWTAIVGDDWPAIGPAEWGRLETVVRDGTSGLDLHGLEQARRDFESRVRASHSLQPVKDDVRAQLAAVSVLTEALADAAALLGNFADLTHRIRNQILDIVDQATERIAAVRKAPGAEGDPVSVQIYRIVSAAREEVTDAVSVAAHTGVVNTAAWADDGTAADSGAALGIGRHDTDPAAGTAAHDVDPAVGRAGHDAGPVAGTTAHDADAGPAAASTVRTADGTPPQGVSAPDQLRVSVSASADASSGDSGPLPVAPMFIAPQVDSPSVAAPARAVSAAISPPANEIMRTDEPAGTAAPARASAPDDSAAAGPGSSSVRAPIDDGGSSSPAGDSEYGRGPDRSAGSDGDRARGAGGMLGAVVGGAMAAAATPAFEVGGQRIDGDLVLARTILASVLSAVESSWNGVAFAVSVVRHQGGVRAFVTSNEGRGWLPQGLYLPRETCVLGKWAAADYAPWEGISDPARILAEFAVVQAHRSGARLSALVSSQRIDPDLRRQLGDVPVEGPVAASAAMPLAAPGPGLLDRLQAVATSHLLTRTERVPGHLIGATCAELAWDAHERVGQLAASSAETLGAPPLRERVLTAVRRGREVPEQWWEELRDIDDLLAASILARRADVSRIPLGELRSDGPGWPGPESAGLRAMVFQRRCDELALILAGPPHRQQLRDAVYAHGQVADHPSLGSVAAADPITPIPGKPRQ
jgi:hypothetical protein